MSEESKRLKECVIDAVVGGDLERLGRSLASLSKVDPGEYLRLTAQLIDTNLPKEVHTLCFVSTPEFFHADGVVYAAAFADAPTPNFFSRNAHPSGAGLALEGVKRIVTQARSEYEAVLLKKVLELKERMSEIDFLLGGHSDVDRSLASLARADLTKGQAPLVAALASTN